MKLEEIQLAKKHAYIKENYEKWNFLEAFSASDDYKTEPKISISNLKSHLLAAWLNW